MAVQAEAEAAVQAHQIPAVEVVVRAKATQAPGAVVHGAAVRVEATLVVSTAGIELAIYRRIVVADCRPEAAAEASRSAAEMLRT